MNEFKPTDPPVNWYEEATLFLDGNLLRAGTLIQCVRRWGLLDELDREAAQIRLGSSTALRVIKASEIADLMKHKGYRFA